MDYSQAFFLYIATIKVCDALTVLGLWYGCWYLRFYSALFAVPKGIPGLEAYARVSVPLVLVYSALFHVVGAYRRDRIHFGFRSTKKVVQGAVLGMLVFVSICYFLDEVQYSRVFLALFSVMVVLGLLCERAILQIGWWWLEKHFIRKVRILLVGMGDLLDMYISRIEERRPYPFEWVGRLGDPDIGQIEAALFHERPDMVVVSYPTTLAAKYEEILGVLSNELVSVKVLPDFGRYSTFTYRAEDECGMPLLAFNQAPTGSTDRVLKRVIDIAGSLAFLVLFSPVYLAISLLVKLSSKGPVFYSQVRVGADGRVFTIYKFRSMRTDAEAQSGAVWASEEDPRTTPLGSWLRRTSLDETPQFWNVLRGDMSLVGPRPERPVFVDQFRREVPKYMLRHRMKSGITGWAQVNGWRGNTSIDERIKADLYYIGHWSHLLDIKILCLTVIKGFIHRNAY